ncbi:GSCOCT00014073001.2-RA-CDS [Cotesia congregata]|uniref:chitinase n=1 Tax=Cotesia congregata TaxID=51543 RepID=A0A8J2MCH0_COTCN|nr:GSCOCT00014073001.2-RA-CDS [Cotesia congregata]CAG5083653.1 chitotriosidase chitinase [Cotesia congregata]
MKIFIALAVLYFTACAAEKKIVCYYTSWSNYRKGNGKFEIEDIDPKLCTHLIYSFVGLNGNNIKILKPGNKNGFQRFQKLKARNPSVKTMLAIGGWNEGTPKYSQMAKTHKSRIEFANNAVQFLKKYKFNGLDVDWEYPVAGDGGSPQDYDNFVELLKVLKYKFSKHKLLLSAAVAAGRDKASRAYNIPEISKYLDLINLMAYDFHGSWEPRTGHNAPLHVGRGDQDRYLNSEAAVNFWLSKGAPKKKLILGVPTYGRTFTLSNPRSNGLGAATSGPGSAGPYTGQEGYLGYQEICEMQKKGGWKISYNKEREAVSAYKGNQWVGFDNVKSIKAKAEFVKKMGLGGAMVWAIDVDDFNGVCGEKYPLVKTLNAVLRSGKEVSQEEPAEVDNSQENEPDLDDSQNNEPEQPASVSKDVCTKVGNIADSFSCGYFACSHDGRGGFLKYSFSCQPGLCYNYQKNQCDYK